jgi:large subunit ribosomal protein L21
MLDDSPVFSYTLPTMIAIIHTGGKQYIVREGQELKVETLKGNAGDAVSFDVLLRAEEDGSKVDVGTPNVSGAKVEGTIMEHGRNKKIEVVHYKAKVRYKKRVGHRQGFTKVKITKVG